jgi:hypothetical protein
MSKSKKVPAWTLIHSDYIDELDLPGALVVLTDPEDGSVSIPLFSDEALAEDFIAQVAMENVSVLRLESSVSMREWLPKCPAKGITHVRFNPTTDPEQVTESISVKELSKRLLEGKT